MLALWSRATRTPGTCRCISCISKHAALNTRTGVRTSWLLSTPTSTFVYTTVFAAGLAIDARSKQQRNKQWDTAFDQLRGEMGESMSDGKGTGSAAADAILVKEVSPPEIDVDALHRVAGMELEEQTPVGEPRPEVHVEDIAESFWDYLPFDNRLPDGRNEHLAWPANTGPDVIRHHLPPQSLWSPENMRWTAIRKRQTWKKLAMQELAISELIHALLALSDVARLPKEVFAPLSPVIRDIALLSQEENWEARRVIRGHRHLLSKVSKSIPSQEIEQVKTWIRGPTTPAYHQDSDGDFYGIAEQMNAAVRKLLNEEPPQNDIDRRIHFPTVLAKVCHNLLVSSAAPDVQTFNILLTSLKQKRQPRLVADVIRAFEYCKIRPNEISCAVILDHYIDMDDPDGFSDFVTRMRGGLNALMLARPDITINEMGESRLIRVSEGKVYQKVHPTPLVFNSLMLGVLKFAGFDRAVDIYFEMKEDGWGLDTLGLSYFLRDCVQRADWNGGVVIWEEISSIKQRIKELHLEKAYSDMLSLCSITGNTVAFNQLINEVARRGLDRSKILASITSVQPRARGSATAAPSAPAWTADNVLIAVSGLMGSDQQETPATEASQSAFEETETDGDQHSTIQTDRGDARPSDYALEGASSTQQPQPRPQPPLSKEEAWDVWLQHELGDSPPEGSAPSRGDDLPTFNFDENEKRQSGKHKKKKQNRGRNSGDSVPE